MKYTQAGSVNRTKKSTEKNIRLSGKFVIKNEAERKVIADAIAKGESIRININELTSKFENSTNKTFFGISLGFDKE